MFSCVQGSSHSDSSIPVSYVPLDSQYFSVYTAIVPWWQEKMSLLTTQAVRRELKFKSSLLVLNMRKSLQRVWEPKLANLIPKVWPHAVLTYPSGSGNRLTMTNGGRTQAPPLAHTNTPPPVGLAQTLHTFPYGYPGKLGDSGAQLVTLK